MKNLHSMRRDPTEPDPQQLDKVRKTLRGRAEKACVRCRAKKRTCDGQQPCQRCKESHSACYFSDWHYTVPYPREYVEYLEEQQEQLSSGLMTMYRLLKESNITTIPPLPEKLQAQDLLVALRGLRLDKPPHPPPSSQQHRHTNGSIINFADDATPPEPTPPDHMMQSYFDGASRSPIQPSMFVPSFPPVPAVQQGSSASGPSPALPAPMPGSFMAMPYPPFDYTRTTHAPMHAQHDHTFSPMHAHSPVFGQLQANGNGITSTSPATWHGSHDPSTSPSTAIHMSPRSSAPGRSPCSVAEGSDHNDSEHSHHQQQQHYWSWPEAGFYGNGVTTSMGGGTGLAAPHDLGLGVGMESIESRTRIGPHDSQAG